ncbi:MAG: TetR/AcrR family transcriptional regulator [Bacteroidota bacterium]
MGIAERKEREKREMRERILEAAMRLFVEHGFEKTSIRKIADAIEYSPATIYLYFKDKSEVFFELHRMAFGRFRETMGQSLHVADPMERMRFIGRVYIDFALQNPEQYDLMFIMRAPMESKTETDGWEVGHKAFEMLETTVKECLDQGLIQGEDYRFVSYALWGSVHGLVALAVRDRLKMYDEEDPREHIFAAFDEVMSMLTLN